jgi:hypothetical protein
VVPVDSNHPGSDVHTQCSCKGNLQEAAECTFDVRSILDHARGGCSHTAAAQRHLLWKVTGVQQLCSWGTSHPQRSFLSHQLLFTEIGTVPGQALSRPGTFLTALGLQPSARTKATDHA